MERSVLPPEAAGQANAPLLRRAFSDGRDQLHVSSPAHGVGPGSMGSRGARRFPVRAQGAGTDYAQEAAQGYRRLGLELSRNGRQVEGAPGTAAVSVGADFQEGRAAAGCVSRLAAVRAPRGVRVPPSVVVRRRGLGTAT